MKSCKAIVEMEAGHHDVRQMHHRVEWVIGKVPVGTRSLGIRIMAPLVRICHLVPAPEAVE
jgi:hypothetical protein